MMSKYAPPLSNLSKAKRIAVLISGNGSNLQAIIDAIQEKKLDAEIAVVVSNKVDAYGLTRAKNVNIPTEVIEKSAEISREDYDLLLKNCLLKYSPDSIILSGFMRILSKEFVEFFDGRVLNLHPALLPKYPGLNTYERAIKAGDKEHGSTVHIVTADLDAGPIVLQEALPIFPEDTAETLKQRTQALEHQLYPKAIQLWIEQWIKK